MSSMNQFDGGREEQKDLAGAGAQDAELEQALKDFRLTVHAWSEAAYNRPRRVEAGLRRRAFRTWRLAAGWALGCALVVGGVSGGVYERHHAMEVAKIRAAQEAEHQRQMAAQKAAEEEEALARVDSDVSREVPSAMEPLAQLMGDEGTR
jgi:hypothetical protein